MDMVLIYYYAHHNTKQTKDAQLTLVELNWILLPSNQLIQVAVLHEIYLFASFTE